MNSTINHLILTSILKENTQNIQFRRRPKEQKELILLLKLFSEPTLSNVLDVKWSFPMI